MEGTIIKRIALILITVLLLSACVDSQEEIKIYNETSEDTEKAEKIFEGEDRLRSAIVVFHEDDFIAGVTVGTFARFHKKKIEKELKGKLEKEYPEAKILVSADNKIVMETQKLAKIEEEEKIKKKIKKIKTLSEEET